MAEGGADETILVRFIVDARNAIAEAEGFREGINSIKDQLRELSAATGLSVSDIAEGMKRVHSETAETREEIGRFNKMVSVGVREINKEAREAEKAVEKMNKKLAEEQKRSAAMLMKIGDALKFALGLGLAQIFGSVIEALKEGVQVGKEFATELFRLGASTRALQRVGMDITISEVVDQVRKLREEFSFFTTREIVAGIGQIQLLSRNFQFTKEEMQDVMRISTALAVIQGRDLGETARQLALFFSSGYAEALQKAGFAVNRLTVQEEAQRLGMNKTYIQLTEVERAHAALSLVRRQALPVLEELTNFEESLAGKITAAEANIKEQKNIISLHLTPVYNALINAVAKVVEWFTKLYLTMSKLSISFYSTIIPPFIAIIAALKAVRNGYEVTLDDIIEQTKEARRQLEAELEKTLGTGLLEDLVGKDYGGMILPGIEDRQDEIIDNMTDFFDSMLEAQRQFEEGSLDAWRDYQDGLAEASARYRREQERATREYYERLEELQREYEEDIARENEDYLQEIADINREAQDDIRDAQEDYREEELRSEREFQERMRRLREEFLFDLEDALRERDALQVLRLIRRYKLDKEQAEREHELEREERRRRFEEEIRDIQEQRARKLRELQIEHEQRLAEIEAEHQREMELAKEQFQETLEQLREQWEEERKQLREEYEQRIKELEANLERKVKAIIYSLAKEGKLTEQELRMLANVWGAYLGRNGVVDRLVQYYTSLMNNMVTSAMQDIQLLEQLLQRAYDLAQQIDTTASSSGGTTGGKQFGGYVGQGTYKMGESGYEFVLSHKTTTALERINGAPLTQQKIIELANRPAVAGLARIEVWISPGLEGRIIDSALANAAVEIRRVLGGT